MRIYHIFLAGLLLISGCVSEPETADEAELSEAHRMYEARQYVDVSRLCLNVLKRDADNEAAFALLEKAIREQTKPIPQDRFRDMDTSIGTYIPGYGRVLKNDIPSR